MKTILIVEDDALIGDFLVAAISGETPHRAVLVADSTRALEVLQQTKPDLFLLDYHLPGTNGLELYEQLHSMDGLGSIPTILMSAGVLQYGIGRRKIVGISKPVELNKLLDLIEELLAQNVQ